jgi:hypothetical protein
MAMQNNQACFCTRDIISTCAANSNREQKNCRFYSKASYKNKCMHFIFGEYCDCVDAQMSTAKEMVVPLE